MDIYTATEQAYKNGYEQGQKDAQAIDDKAQIKEIAKVLSDNNVKLDFWDHYNDDFNEDYEKDCLKVAKVLFKAGCRIVKGKL